MEHSEPVLSALCSMRIAFAVVGLDGVEPSTSRLSGVRSNRTELQAPGCFWITACKMAPGLILAQRLGQIALPNQLGFWIMTI